MTRGAGVAREAELSEQTLATVAKGAGIALVGRFTGGFLAYVFSILVARRLGAESFGLFSLASSIVLLVMTFGRLGLDNALLRFVAIYRGEGALAEAKGAVRLALRVAAISSATLTLAVVAGADVIANAFFRKPELGWVLRTLVCMMPFANLAVVALAATQACRVMTYVALTNGFIVPLLQVAVLLAALALGSGLGGAIIAFVVSQIAAAAFAYRFALRVMPELRDHQLVPRPEGNRLLRFAAPMMFVDVIGLLLMWLDTLLLGPHVPARDLGLYSAAARTATAASIVLLGMNALFAPTMADLFNRDQRALLERMFKTITKWVITIALPIFLLCVFQGEEILALFGPDFRAAALPLAILAAGQLVNAGTGSVGYILIMSGRQKLALADQIGTLALAVALNLWLIPRLGVLGAAIAMAVSISLTNLLRLAQVWVLLRMHPYDKSFRQPLVASVAALVVSGALVHLFVRNRGGVSFGVSVATFAGVYVAALVALGLSREDYMVIDRVRTRLGI